MADDHYTPTDRDLAEVKRMLKRTRHAIQKSDDYTQQAKGLLTKCFYILENGPDSRPEEVTPKTVREQAKAAMDEYSGMEGSNRATYTAIQTERVIEIMEPTAEVTPGEFELPEELKDALGDE